MRPGTHTDQRCKDCQEAEPIVRPFIPPRIWYCATCSSVLCSHSAIEPTSYGNAWCDYCSKERARRKK
jgi:hypothetical protein